MTGGGCAASQKAGDNRRFGEIAIELGYINNDAIRRYVDFVAQEEQQTRLEEKQ
jgi:hypothetical protein